MLPPALAAIMGNLERVSQKTARQEQILAELQRISRLFEANSDAVQDLMESMQKSAAIKLSGPVPGFCPCCGR